MRTEFFTDSVILKAHYRVKHVDKGIEFAGRYSYYYYDLSNMWKVTEKYESEVWLLLNEKAITGR